MGEREPGNKRILIGFMNGLLDEADVKVVKFRNMNPLHLNMQYNSSSQTDVYVQRNQDKMFLLLF